MGDYTYTNDYIEFYKFYPSVFDEPLPVEKYERRGADAEYWGAFARGAACFHREDSLH